VIALLAIIIVSASWIAGSSLSAPARASVGNLPTDLVGKPVEFSSDSGATLHGWLIQGQKGVGAIVLMHGVRANRLSMVDKVGQIRAPKFFIAGSEDKYTPLNESRQMFESARDPKEFWIVNGAGHEDLYRFECHEYERRVLEFFSQYLRT
jgi:fermentation-respiration switch protein FrsA (DUF1100 family)